VRARQPVHGRERLAVVVDGPLLGHGWAAERASDRDAAVRAGLPSELPGYDCAVIVHRRRA
jgi:hypothetical protein